jgi:hypothetical protein
VIFAPDGLASFAEASGCDGVLLDGLGSPSYGHELARHLARRQLDALVLSFASDGARTRARNRPAWPRKHFTKLAMEQPANLDDEYRFAEHERG